MHRKVKIADILRLPGLRGPLARCLWGGALILGVVLVLLSVNGRGALEAELVCGLADLYAAEGQYDRALDTYGSFSAERGRSPFVRLKVAATLYEMGDLPAAEATYRELLEAEPGSPVVLYNLACVVAGQGRKNEARILFGRFTERYGAVLPGLAASARSRE